jgi:hypothetical protein
MHVEVLVSVDVVHSEPRRAKAFKLRGDLGVGLVPELRGKIKCHAEA